MNKRARHSSTKEETGKAEEVSESQNEDEGEDLMSSFVSYEEGENRNKKDKKRKHVSEENVNEYEELQKELDDEIPTLNSIMQSNTTKTDKKTCLKLFEQMSAVERADGTNAEYYRLVDSINIILSKSKTFSTEEIRFLENEEEKLTDAQPPLDLKTKILRLEAPTEIKGALLKQYSEMQTYSADSPLYNSLREEIEWSVKLPHSKKTRDVYLDMNMKQLTEFYAKMMQKLNEELFGMQKVKENLLQIWNDRRTASLLGHSCGRNLGLCGPAGVGKSAIAKAFAKALGKKFVKISAASLDPTSLKGSNKVWIGSEPSFLLQLIAEHKTNDLLIMIDEVDKLELKGQYALLHVTDAADNKQFQDNYLKNFSHDLSNITFILNMNTTATLDSALRDRLDIVEVPEYTKEEKAVIIREYTLPRILKDLGMSKGDILLSDKCVEALVVTGLRDIEKNLKRLCSKINLFRSVKTETLGLSYSIPKFKLPLKIEYPLFQTLL